MEIGIDSNHEAELSTGMSHHKLRQPLYIFSE